MDLNDPYHHPTKAVRRFVRLQTWTAAAISLVGTCFIVGGFAAGGYVLLKGWGVAEGSAWTYGRLIGGLLGIFALTFVYTIFRLTTRAGRWLHYYTLLALSEYARF